MAKFTIEEITRKLATTELRHVTQLERADVVTDEESRTAQMSFLSDAPIRHWFGYLTLDMSPSSIDLTRFRSGAPLLVCHDRHQQVGIIENPRIENGKLRGDTRFSKSVFAGEIFQDVVDGIRKTTSSGFQVHELVLEKSTEDEDYYRATKWEPFEGSLEPIPADISVGVNRSLEDSLARADEEKDAEREADDSDEVEDPDPETDEDTETGERAATLQTEVKSMEPTELEVKRTAEARITELGVTFGEVELARDFIAEDLIDEGEFKKRVLAKRKASQVDILTPEPKDVARQSGVELARTIPRHTGKLKAFRGENAHERAYRTGQFFLASIFKVKRSADWCRANGLPLERAHTEQSNEKGGIFVPVEVGNEIIDLREEYGVFRRNAKVVPMASETKTEPRRTGGLTAYAVGETDGITESEKSWDMISLVAKKWGVIAKYSTEVSEDASISTADDLISEMAYAFANKEDECGFNGDGTSTYHGMTGVRTKLKGLDATIANIAGLVVGTGNAYSELVAGDFLAVLGKTPEYVFTRSQPKWYCSQTFWATVMQKLVLAAGGVSASEMEKQVTKMFLGYPVEISQVMPKVEGNSQVCALFGALELAAMLGDRRSFTVSTSDSNEDDFKKDLLSIKATTRSDINVHDVGNASATASLQVAGPIVGLITAAS